MFASTISVNFASGDISITTERIGSSVVADTLLKPTFSSFYVR